MRLRQTGGFDKCQHPNAPHSLLAGCSEWKVGLLILLLICLAMVPVASRAEQVPLIELTQSNSENLAPQVLILLDETGQLSPFDILKLQYTSQWSAHKAKTISRGYNSTPFWVQFRLDASKSIHKEWSLVLANPLLDYIDIYQVFPGSGPRLIYRSGIKRPNQGRIEDHRFFIVPVEVYEPTTFLMRIETSPNALLPLRAYPRDQFWSPLIQADIGNSVYFGILLAMVLYNFFLYVTVRDVSYLFYVLFISSFALTQLSLDGYLAQYFWPSGLIYPYENNFWLTLLAVTFGSFFVIHFLNLRQTSRRHLWAMYGMIALQGLAASLLLTIDLTLFARIYALILLLFMGLAISAGIRAWQSGFMAAKFFVLAWVLFALGNSFFVLNRLLGLESPIPPNLPSKLGSFAETMLLSFALAYRIRLLREDQERQRMRVEAQSQFLAQISHEIRTPLNGVLGMTEVLSRTQLDQEQRGYVETIQGSGSSLLALINDILDYSKIEAGKMAFRREAVDVHHLLEQQVKLFLSQAEHKSLTLTCSIELAVPVWVMVDAQHLRQVLSNLVSNAIKYTDQGYVTLSLSIDPRAPRLLIFTIEDSGIGISQTDQKNLFSLYSQVDPVRQRKFGGTGLGLAISQELVVLMEGSLEVSSALTEGSCFTVKLPFLLAQQRTVTAGSADSLSRQRLKVLVAEDNMVNQRVIQGLLEKLGHQVIVVSHGGEAIEARQSEQFDCDLLLMDCEMPEVDGYQATKAIRTLELNRNLPHLPIVALTAHALEDVRRQCLDAGMDGFLTKPINTRYLIRLLEQMTRDSLA